MRGLLLKDFYALRIYFKKQILLMVVLYAALSVAMQSFTFLSSMLMMYGMMIYMSAFSVDEACRWNAYACTLPVSPRAAVASRLVLLLTMVWGIGLIATIVPLPLELLLFDGDVYTSLTSFPAVAAVYTVVGIISLPIYYKVGVERARMATTLMFIVPFLAVIWAMKLWDSTLSDVFDASAVNWPLVAAVCAVVLAALCAASFFAAVHIYREKEF